MTPISKPRTAPDGTSYTDSAGDGGRATVVLVHGVGDNLAMWDPVVAALAREYRVVCYDMLGHGATTGRVDGDTTLDHYCRQLGSLLAHLHIRRLVLVGFSMGGVVAQQFAQRHPQYLDALVLMSTVYRRTREELQGVGERLALANRGALDQVAALAVSRWFPDHFQRAFPEVVNTVRSRLENNDPVAYANAYRVFVEADASVGDGLRLVTCPTLVVTGSDDVGSTPAMAERMLSDLVNGELVILPGLRHMMTMEAPELVNQTLLKFLRAHVPG